jgi:hypothetical protein
METEQNNNAPGRKRTFMVLGIIISIFIVYYSIMNIMGPARKLTAITEEFGVKHDQKMAIDEGIYSDSAYLALLREKAWLQSKTVMAETDSIYLTINLEDSTANIEISGVVVHKSKISRIAASKILKKGNKNAVFTMLSTPLTIASSFATLKKEPVMIKMAPKDTSEYKPDIIPDTSITEPVNYILNLKDGIRIYVYQEEHAKAGDMMNQLLFDIKERLRDTWRELKSIIRLKVPEYHPFIKLRLPRDDAKIIYRAIPKNGQIAVYI